MKIITWNVNGYRSVTGQNPSKHYDNVTKDNSLFYYVASEKPDILCIQETKASPDQIDQDLLTPPGYEYYYNSCSIKKGYSGVAIFSRYKPKSVNVLLGIDKFDVEGRLIEADFEDFIVFNVYFPKGYAEDEERLTYKLEFYDAIYQHIDKIGKKRQDIIIAHNEIDLARPKENIGTSGFMPVEREKLDILTGKGYEDAFRAFTKDGGHYTWWSQRGRARENNIGWRIDYQFVSPRLAQKMEKCYHHPEAKGSDHCPVVLEIF
jgi:exodeoxyribonuclease-3